MKSVRHCTVPSRGITAEVTGFLLLVSLLCCLTVLLWRWIAPLCSAAVMVREKNSATADKLVQFTGSSQIAGLPPYLTVQMMRFFFKRTPEGGQKAKILRKVGAHGAQC